MGVAAEAARADSRAAETPRRTDGLYAPGRGDDDVPAGRVVAAADSRAIVAVALMVVFVLVGQRGRLDVRVVLDRDVSATATIAGRADRRRAVSGDCRHVGIAADRDVAAFSTVRRRADCRRVCPARDGRDLAARDDDVSAAAVVVVHAQPLRACADGAAVFLDRNGLEIPLALDGERVPWGNVDGRSARHVVRGDVPRVRRKDDRGVAHTGDCGLFPVGGILRIYAGERHRRAGLDGNAGAREVACQRLPVAREVPFFVRARGRRGGERERRDCKYLECC